jgi:hypothetical protein
VGAPPPPATPGASTSAGASASQDAKPPGQPVVFKIDPSKVRIVDPQGNRSEVKDADNVVDGNANSVWKSDRYLKADFGGKKTGMGVWIDLGDAKQVTSVQVVLQNTGADGELRAGTADLGTGAQGDQATVQQYQIVGQARQSMNTTTLFNGPETKTRYLLVWITKLPKDGTGGYRLAIGEITVRVQ